VDDKWRENIEMVEQMNINILNDSDLTAYDKLVLLSDEGTIYHSSWWQKITDNVYGNTFSTNRYGIFENDTLVAAIPISTYKKFGHQFIFNSKLTPYSGPFFLHKPETKNVTRISKEKSMNSEFAKILKNNGICLYYPFGPNHIDLQPFGWEGFTIEVSYTYQLMLEDLTQIWQNIDKKKRSEINLAYSKNYEILYGKINDFVFLNNETMKRQNHAVIPSGLWETLFKQSKERDCCEVFTAYDVKGPTASLFLVWDNKRSYYIGGGIRKDSQNAMSLLIWEAIQYTKNKLNLNQFDFEGSNVKSIEFYFRKFGGKIHPLFAIHDKSLKRKLLMTIHPSIKNNFSKKIHEFC
jgi:Acetyltransferase (GNAT) domain